MLKHMECTAYPFFMQVSCEKNRQRMCTGREGALKVTKLVLRPGISTDGLLWNMQFLHID